jgi:hypothetical protein
MVAGFPNKWFPPDSSAARLAPPFFLATPVTFPQVIKVAQQAKVNAARAEAETARPGEG